MCFSDRARNSTISYVCRAAVADGIPRCKQATLSDFKSTRLFGAFKALIPIDSRGTAAFPHHVTLEIATTD